MSLISRISPGRATATRYLWPRLCRSITAPNPTLYAGYLWRMKIAELKSCTVLSPKSLFWCSVILIVGRDQTSRGLHCIWSCVQCCKLQYCRDPAMQWMMLQGRSRCHHGPTSNEVKLSLQLDSRYCKSIQWVTMKSISCRRLIFW